MIKRQMVNQDNTTMYERGSGTLASLMLVDLPVINRPASIVYVNAYWEGGEVSYVATAGTVSYVHPR